jgi:hypothetical protein
MERSEVEELTEALSAAMEAWFSIKRGGKENVFNRELEKLGKKASGRFWRTRLPEDKLKARRYILASALLCRMKGNDLGYSHAVNVILPSLGPDLVEEITES